MNWQFNPCYNTNTQKGFATCGLKTVICTLELKSPRYSPALGICVSNLDPGVTPQICDLTRRECFRKLLTRCITTRIFARPLLKAGVKPRISCNTGIKEVKKSHAKKIIIKDKSIIPALLLPDFHVVRSLRGCHHQMPPLQHSL